MEVCLYYMWVCVLLSLTVKHEIKLKILNSLSSALFMVTAYTSSNVCPGLILHDGVHVSAQNTYNYLVHFLYIMCL